LSDFEIISISTGDSSKLVGIHDCLGQQSNWVQQKRYIWSTWPINEEPWYTGMMTTRVSNLPIMSSRKTTINIMIIGSDQR
jgi:hypothetical protein